MQQRRSLLRVALLALALVLGAVVGISLHTLTRDDAPSQPPTQHPAAAPRHHFLLESSTAALIAQAKVEFLLTNKSGQWYANHLGAPGHWTAAWALLDQAAGITPLPPPPPPPPTPPAGTILDQKGWEDGLVSSQGFGIQDANTLCAGVQPCVLSGSPLVARGKVFNDGAVADAGARSGRFELPGDTSHRTAAEALRARTPGRGTDDYYAQAFRFSNYAWEGMSFGQYNYQGISGSPFFVAGSEYLPGAPDLQHENRAEDKAHASIFALVNSGNVPDAGSPPYYSGQPRGFGTSCRGLAADKCGPYYYFGPGTLDTNTWYEIVTHIYWTAGNDGVVEGWARKRGDATFTKKFSVQLGAPTLQWGHGWSFPANDGSQTNDKFGGYREASGSPLMVWQDSFCRATTFGAAASCLG